MEGMLLVFSCPLEHQLNKPRNQYLFNTLNRKLNMDNKEDPALTDLVERLSPLEQKIVPYLKLEISEIIEKSGLDATSVLRGLRFLENKKILKLNVKKSKIIDLGVNGIYYKKNHLPERKLLLLLEANNHLPFDKAREMSGLSENEFKVSLGVLKSKAFVSLVNGKLSLTATKEDLIKRSLEEQLLEVLPIEYNKLAPEQLFALENLKKRKNIVNIEEKNETNFELTDFGRKIAGKEIKTDFIEEVTPAVINSWARGKKFRRYDIQAQVPKIYGGKRHFVNQSIEHAKRIWMDMGFKEMTGTKAVTSFWNFDALFTAQDHPVREMHDTFFIKNVKGKLPEKEIVRRVKEAHEIGVSGSKGWGYLWNEETAKRVLIRTHTTALSSQTLAKLKKDELPAKYFAIGKCFRNETVDWKHGFEFNQTEGIVIDPQEPI